MLESTVCIWPMVLPATGATLQRNCFTVMRFSHFGKGLILNSGFLCWERCIKAGAQRISPIMPHSGFAGGFLRERGRAAQPYDCDTLLSFGRIICLPWTISTSLEYRKRFGTGWEEGSREAAPIFGWVTISCQITNIKLLSLTRTNKLIGPLLWFQKPWDVWRQGVFYGCCMLVKWGWSSLIFSYIVTHFVFPFFSSGFLWRWWESEE